MVKKTKIKLHPLYGPYNSKEELEADMKNSHFGQFEKLSEAKSRIREFDAKMKAEQERGNK